MKTSLTKILRIKNLATLSLLLLCTCKSYGYLDPFQPIQNRGNTFYNPAYFVPGKNFLGTFNYINLWTHITPNPQFAMLSTDFNIYQGGIHGGAYLFSERLSSIVDMKITGLHGAGQIPLGKDVILSLGARINYVGLDIDLSKANALDPNDPVLVKKSYYQPDFDFGFWMTSKNGYGGMSVRHILAPEIDVETSDLQYVESSIFQPHFYFTAGYDFKFFNKLNFEPMVRYQSTFSQGYANFDLASYTVMLGYDDTFYLGVNFRDAENEYPTDWLLRYRMKDKYTFFASFSSGKVGSTMNSYSYGLGFNVAL